MCSFTIPTSAIPGRYTKISSGMDDFTHVAGDPLAGVLQADCFSLHRIHPKSFVVRSQHGRLYRTCVPMCREGWGLEKIGN